MFGLTKRKLVAYVGLFLKSKVYLDLRFGFGMLKSFWGTMQEVYQDELRLSFVGRGKFINQTWGLIRLPLVSVLYCIALVADSFFGGDVLSWDLDEHVSE